jgi:phospholipid-binding lipoprotein MlaA
MRGRNLKTVVAALASVAVLGLTGCATAPSASQDVADPGEKVNRAIFKFNDVVDTYAIRPVAQGYHDVVPGGVRTSVRNFLRNLKSPIVIANQALQGDVEGTSGATMRALINTTFGIGGLFDVASDVGIPYEPEDFGQTLAVWGLDHGAYVVLPFLGPSSLRDATGVAVDTYADPLRLWLDNTDRNEWTYARVAVSTISSRAELLGALDDLKKNSIDYYAALRSSYIQHRAALVTDSSSDGTMVDIPDYQ